MNILDSFDTVYRFSELEKWKPDTRSAFTSTIVVVYPVLLYFFPLWAYICLTLRPRSDFDQLDFDRANFGGRERTILTGVVEQEEGSYYNV